MVHDVRTYLKQSPRECLPSSNTRLKESLNTECPKLSAKTTRPPVLSTAIFISATPTYNKQTFGQTITTL